MKSSGNLFVLLILGVILFGCSGGSGSGTSTPSTPEYGFDQAYLQYRQFEDSANNRCYSWLAVTKAGAPAEAGDLVGVEFEKSSGDSQETEFTRFESYDYMYYNCSASPCAEPVQHAQNGYFTAFESLPADTYTIIVNTTDGQNVTRDIQFPGEMELPLVTSATMQARLEGGDLVLNWLNPSSDPDWSEIVQLRIVFFDGNGDPVLYVRLNPDTETVTIPSALISQAAALGSGSLHRWTVQTRAYGETGINFSRGHSRSITLP